MNDVYSFVSNYTEPVTVKTVLFALLLAFAMAQVIAATYIWTFRGMSYSRSFVLAVGVGAIISCTLMLAINNSIAAGLGIAGSLAIIRFRTALRDARDMVFVFASMAAGICAGLRAPLAAVLGTGVFCLVVIALTWADFGGRRKFDGLLRFQLPSGTGEQTIIDLLRGYTRTFALVTLREAAQGEMMEYAYQVQFTGDEARVQLLQELGAIQGMQDVSVMMQESTLEI